VPPHSPTEDRTWKQIRSWVRRLELNASVGPSPVVVGGDKSRIRSRWRRPRPVFQSRRSVRTVRTHCSANAFASGVKGEWRSTHGGRCEQSARDRPRASQVAPSTDARAEARPNDGDRRQACLRSKGKVLRTEGELRRKAADASVDGVGQLTRGLGGLRDSLDGILEDALPPAQGVANLPDTGVHSRPLPWMWLDGGGA
jgi:hypothetical protein